MPKYRNFSLGLNNAAPIDQIDDAELSTANNVEFNHSNNPEKRHAVKDSELNTAMSQLGLTGLVSKFVAWSPKVMPNDSSGSYVYVVYTTDYHVYVIYKTEALTWTAYEVIIDDITYRDTSVMVFSKAIDRIIITDSVNKAHFVKIDEDGLFIEGIMEYPAPKYIPTIEVMGTFKDENFEENSEEGYMGDCGLYVYCWCYADKEFNLSNPSPFSKPVDRQFFSFDDDGNADRWVESLRIGNMKIPALDEDTKKNIKFIYLFRKYYKHTEDLTNINWGLYNVYTLDSVDGFNEFIDFADTAEGQSLDYGNAAPVASDSLAQGGSIFLAGCKTKDSLLWDFEWNFPIKITNGNNDLKVNQIYRVRISNAIQGKRNGIIEYPFSLSEFFTTPDRLRKLCFFAQDKTTPLRSMFIGIGSTSEGPHFDCFIQIPELLTGDNLIYLGFTTLAQTDNFDGIPQEFINLSNKFSYGRMFIPYDIGTITADSWGLQEMFTINHGNLENSRNIVNCPMLMKGDDDNVLNRYDDAWNGEITDCTWLSNPIANIPSIKALHGIDALVGEKSIRLNGSSSKIVFGDKIDAGNSDNVNLKFWYKFNTGEFNLINQNTICGNFYETSGNDCRGWYFGIWKVRDEDSLHFFFVHGDENDPLGFAPAGFKRKIFDTYNIIDDFGIDADVNFYINLSFQPNDKRLNIYVVDENNDLIFSFDSTIEMNEYKHSESTQVLFGDIGETQYDHHRSIPNSILQFISYTKNRTVDSLAVAFNLANKLHYTEGDKIIGYNWVDGSAYNNIEIQDGYLIEYKNKNSIMWSNTRSVRFKISNQREFQEAHKVLLPAPYFIKTEYGNSVLEITRNTINRITLNGTPDEWALDSNNFITEYSELGSLSPGGWGVYRDRVFGHTEAGLIMWDKDGFNIISNKKKPSGRGYSDEPRIIVPMKTTLISYPVPLRNQYVWHDNETNISYVYHLDQDAFTLFSGLDVVDTDVIDKGDNLENLTLMLTSTHIFKLYPDENNYFNGEPEIRTKGYELNDEMVKKVIPKFAGTDCDIVVFTKNKDGFVQRTHAASISEAIQYILNGAWGSYFYITFGGNIEKLYDFEVIPQRRF